MSDLAVGNGLLAARITATRDFLDLGSGPATIELYDGVRPGMNGAPTTLLAVVELAKPCGDIVGNALVLTVPVEGLVLVSGAITWARVKNGNGDFAFDCNVTLDTASPAGAITAAAVQVYAGGAAKIISGTFG